MEIILKGAKKRLFVVMKPYANNPFNSTDASEGLKQRVQLSALMSDRWHGWPGGA